MAKMRLYLSKNEIMDAVISYYESEGYDVDSLQLEGDRYGLTGGVLNLNCLKKEGEE